MLTDTQVQANIVSWASAEDAIRAVVMVGSRARPSAVDELADFDISLFVREAAPYLQDGSWMDQIGPVWVCVADQYPHDGLTIPTRLVIFDDGIKVDFSFFPVALLESVGQSEMFNEGYEVLVDKDNVTAAWSPPTLRPEPATPPDLAEFSRVINEFWFEVYHVAKYLKRGELWLVKFRDWSTKEFLLTMLEWQAQATHGPEYHTHYMGKHLRQWLEPAIWNELHQIFAPFEASASWSALHATMRLFRAVAKEAAALWNYPYPDELDHHITAFVTRLEHIAGQGA